MSTPTRGYVKLPEGVVTRLRASTAPARQRVDMLLESENADERIASLHPVDFYDLIRDVGISDATDLIMLAAPEQLQVFADLDIWRRDSFVAGRFDEWIDLYLQLDDERFARLWHELDPELIPLYLKERITVWPNDEDEPPAVPISDERPLESSPDNTYLVQYPLDEDEGKLARLLIERIYDVLGVAKGWMMLESVRWEMRSSMEEMALRFRRGRLADFGFADFEEGMAIYAYVDPQRVREEIAAEHPDPRPAADVDLHLRTGTHDALAVVPAGEEDFLGACLDRLDLSNWDLVEPQLVSLVNLAAAADGVEPRERSALGPLLARVTRTLNVGLEFLAEGDEERGIQLLTRVPLRHIFRAGHGLALKLQQTARGLVAGQKCSVTDSDTSLLSAAETDLVEGLLLRRPARRETTREPFARWAEIGEAADTLSYIAFQEALLIGIMKLSRDEMVEVAYRNGLAVGPEGVGFANLFATMVLRAHTDGVPSLEPYEAETVPTDADTIRAAFEPWRDGAFLRSAQTPPAMRAAAKRFVGRVERSVLDELTQPQGPPDPRFVRAVLLLGTSEASRETEDG